MKTKVRKIIYIFMIIFLVIMMKNTKVQAVEETQLENPTETTEQQPVTDNEDKTGKEETPQMPTNNGNTSTENTNTEKTTTKKSSEARLQDLGIKPNDFKGFKKDIATYDVEVPNDVKKVEVYAKAIDSKAKISGIGNITLQEGINTAKVVVTAEDGTTKTYTINITRKVAEQISSNEPEVPEEQPEQIEKKELSLTSLLVKDSTLTPKFNEKTYEYKIELTEDIDLLDIEAKSSDPNATIEIIGNKDLKEGENIITILVSDSKSEQSATYQIIVNKNLVKEETVAKVNWLQPSTWTMKEKRIVGIIAIILLIIVVILLIKVRLSKAEFADLPGSEELDKALIEHQELTEDFGNSETFNNFKINESSLGLQIDDITDEEIDNITNREDMERREEEIKEKKVEMKIPEEYFEYTPLTKKKGKHF